MFAASPFTAVAFTAAEESGTPPPTPAVRFVVPRACRRVAVDIDAPGRRVDPRACEVRPAT